MDANESGSRDRWAAEVCGEEYKGIWKRVEIMAVM